MSDDDTQDDSASDQIEHSLKEMRTRDEPTDWRASAGVIDPELAAAIGYVAVHWAMAQAWQNEIIALMLGTKLDASHAVTAELTDLQRADLIRSLLVHAGQQECLDEWDDIIRFAEPLRNLRNDAIHSQWGISGDGENSFYRVRSRGKPVIRSEVITVDQMTELSEKTLAFINKTVDFFNLLVRFGGYGIATVIPDRPPLAPGHGREALAQDLARAQKRARKQADRDRSQRLPAARVDPQGQDRSD